MEVCASEEEVGSALGESMRDADAHENSSTSLPEPYLHFFNQLGSECNRSRSNSSGSSSSNQSEEIQNEDDQDKNMPLSTLNPHPYDASGSGGHSLDLFGSYLQQDYQQSDYNNNDLFDEHMFVTC